MKKFTRFLNILIITIISANFLSAQITAGQTDDFSTGLQNWERGSVSNGMLELSADGAGQNGKLVTFNQNQWSGNYFAEGVTDISLDIKNPGSKTLYMRIALGTTQNPNSGIWYVSSDSVEINPGTNTLQNISYSLDSANMTLATSSGSYFDLIRNVNTLRILHNSVVSAKGEPIDTDIKIDNITAESMTSDYQNNSLDEITFYPNPVKNWFSFTEGRIINSLKIYDLTGKKLKSWKIKNSDFRFNVEDIPSGLYIIKIVSDGQKSSIKMMVN